MTASPSTPSTRASSATPAAPPAEDPAAAPDPAPTLVVLDMAGTTVADDGLVERAFARAAEEAGTEPGSPEFARQLDHVRATMGESKITVFRALFSDEDRARRANSAFERAYARLVDSGACRPLPGAEDTIRELRAQGRKVALATGFSRTTQDAVLDALGWREIADLTLCPADAGRGRPHPDLVLTALLRTGAASVRHVAVAGDTAYDMLSGVRAGASRGGRRHSPAPTTGRGCGRPAPPTSSTRSPDSPRCWGSCDMSGPRGIRFDRVTVSYGRSTVLDALDLTVAPGEVMALLGPSGSGKTTALRAVAGFVAPSSGRVLIGDRDVTGLPPHKRGIGMVVQQYALFPHLRVEQNVAFGLRARRTPRAQTAERVAEALEMTGMAGYARRYPRELSGGQQQRVAIARALAIRPGVLLLDEPLSALDARLRSGMLAELARLHRELPDVSILYVTHDQIEALTLADRIAVTGPGPPPGLRHPARAVPHPAHRLHRELRRQRQPAAGPGRTGRRLPAGRGDAAGGARPRPPRSRARRRGDLVRTPARAAAGRPRRRPGGRRRRPAPRGRAGERAARHRHRRAVARPHPPAARRGVRARTARRRRRPEAAPAARRPVALTFDAEDAVLLPGGLAGGDGIG